MEACSDMFDFLKLTNGKRNVEIITPHKISVIAFIREFCLLKQEGNEGNYECTMAPKFRKDFCMLALKLIQCPDMEYRELELLFTSGKYNLLSTHLQNFCTRLQQIYEQGIGALMDCITSTVDKLMIERQATSRVLVNRSSVLGLYLRRMLLYLDKLTFVQVAAVYRAFCLYYQNGRPGLVLRSLSKDKLNNCDGKKEPPLQTEEKSFDQSMKIVALDRENTFEESQWSRRQAELFVAQQATLLQINEPKALHPKKLQKIIRQIMNDLPEYADAHFLSFMNCLRIREYCGAQNALFSCFDRNLYTVTSSSGTDRNRHFLSFMNCLRIREYCGAQNALFSCFDRNLYTVTSSSGTDRNRGFRFAALNLAVLYAHFGHKHLSVGALREAMVMSQEAGDAAALQHALCWLLRVSRAAARPGLLRRAAAAPRLPHTHRGAVAAQALAQHAAVSGSMPARIFKLMVKSDVINYQHSMTDLLLTSLANSAALWSLYGKTEMASISCQLLLNLNTSNGGAWHGGNAVALATAGAVAGLCWRGEPAAAALAHARRRFPHAPLAALWMRVEYVSLATHAFHTGKWQEAEQSIQQLASIDRWESQLLKGELYFLRGEPMQAIESLKDVLDHCINEDASLHYMAFKVRAMILVAQVQNAFSGIHSTSSTNIILLNEALTIAKKHYLHYLAATIEMHVANIQLHLGCVTNSLCIVKKVLPIIMAHGGPYDRARGMLLYVKCKIAAAPILGEIRNDVFNSCCGTLETIKTNFAQVEAHGRLIEALYLQAQLYNEVGNYTMRNQCAFQYRQLEEQNPTKPSTMLLTCF